jgi:hypothetical protein
VGSTTYIFSSCRTRLLFLCDSEAEVRYAVGFSQLSRDTKRGMDHVLLNLVLRLSLLVFFVPTCMVYMSPVRCYSFIPLFARKKNVFTMEHPPCLHIVSF